MEAEFFVMRPEARRAAGASDVVLADGWGAVWGVLPIDLGNDRTHLPEQVEAQTRQVLANLEEILAAKGLRKESVVAVRVALVDLPRLQERMETAYAGFFAASRLPARSLIGVSHLPRGALVAMDFTLRIAAP
jgi:enamine deaminase RidA (YjgF/YER057c/UK114 family)